MLLAISAVGYLMFITGFYHRVDLGKRKVVLYNVTCEFTVEQVYAEWLASSVGPLVYIGALAHVASWKRPGRIVVVGGTAFLSIVYLTAIGPTLYVSRDLMSNMWSDQAVWIEVQAVGGLVSCLFWALAFATWPFNVDYPNEHPQPMRLCTPLHGAARKIATAFILSSAIGWVFYLIAIALARGSAACGGDPFCFTEWIVVSAFGPLVYVGALVHAILWGKLSFIAGGIAGFASVVYCTSLGSTLYGSVVIGECHWELYQYAAHNGGMALGVIWFVGSLISASCWAITIALWPLYAAPYQDTSYGYAPIQP